MNKIFYKGIMVMSNTTNFDMMNGLTITVIIKVE